jgi:predicted ATPase/DNA-binding CsgD family transcriptional regulator
MEGKALLPDPLTGREKDILARLSTGLSDQQIAAELFLSPNTIRWYNRQIYSKLGVSNRMQAIAHAKAHGLLETSDSAPLMPESSCRLPVPTTPFIERSREIAELKRLLQTTRLLTLTGVGGTGKTRLALYVAADVSENFADGVYFVDLASIDDSGQVAKAIAAAVHVLEQPNEPLLDTLKRAFARRALLLVIDNFEHVITAAPLISRLLTASPHLRIMVTSREALRLSGEQEYQVPPLSLPSGELVSVQDVSVSEAGALFLQRTKMIQPRFTFNDENASAIAQICRRLDGLPLAIELAAARCKLLTPHVLLDRLESPLNILTKGSRDAPTRQRTLRDTIEWSYNLLNDAEKTLFARLAVFRSGCSLEGIESICADELSTGVFDTLASLVDKSLVHQKETTESELRFVMLETIREYALERLQASGEAEVMRQHHVDYFVELAEQAEPELRLAQQRRWFKLLETEQENMLAALEWSLAGGAITPGIRLTSALCWYWYTCGRHVEGLHWTQQWLPHLDDAPEQYHAKFLIGAAHMMQVHNRANVRPLLMKALTISRQRGDRYHTAYTLIRLGYHRMAESNSLPMVEEGLALFRELGHKPGIAHALTIIGEIARFSGDDNRAQRAYEETLMLCRQIGDTRGILITLLNLTFIAQRQGDDERAKTSARQALELACAMDLRAEIAECLVALAGIIGSTQQPELAARLFGSAETAIERLGAFFDAPDRPEFDRMIAAVRAQLDEPSFQAAWAEGKQMMLEQAVECALNESR